MYWKICRRDLIFRHDLIFLIFFLDIFSRNIDSHQNKRTQYLCQIGQNVTLSPPHGILRVDVIYLNGSEKVLGHKYNLTDFDVTCSPENDGRYFLNSGDDSTIYDVIAIEDESAVNYYCQNNVTVHNLACKTIEENFPQVEPAVDCNGLQWGLGISIVLWIAAVIFVICLVWKNKQRKTVARRDTAIIPNNALTEDIALKKDDENGEEFFCANGEVRDQTIRLKM